MKHRIALACALGAVLTVATACGGDDGTPDRASTSTADGTVTETEAIAIAADEIRRTEPGFEIDATRPVVVKTPEGWDVGFPDTDPTVLNGEPHVVVDARSGAIVTTYRTR